MRATLEPEYWNVIVSSLWTVLNVLQLDINDNNNNNYINFTRVSDE